MSHTCSRSLTNLLSVLIVIISSTVSAFAGCPTGQVSKNGVAFSATMFDKDGHDENRILGVPDAEFAKLDKDDEYIILKLDKVLTPGQKVILYFASYDDKSTAAIIEGSANGSSFFGSQTVTTSIEKDEVDTACVGFSSNVRYIKISYPDQYGLGKLMLDALGAQEEVCFVDLDLSFNAKVCKTSSSSFCINDLFNLDSLYGNSVFSLNDDNNISDGSVDLITTSTQNYSDCCGSEKPSLLTFKYVASNIVDNNQGTKASVTNYQSTNGQDVLIVANHNSSPSDLSDPYFSKVVSAGESFTIDRANGNWRGNMYLHIMTTNGNTALQLVGFHTSCSAPIVPGDQFGYLQLVSTVIDGSFCGNPNTNDCSDVLVYSPDQNGATVDTVLVDVCFENAGAQFCDQVEFLFSVDQTCAKTVGNTRGCSNKPYVIWLKDKNGSAHHLRGDSTKYQWIENDNGEAELIAEGLSAAGLDGTFDVHITYTGKTTTAPTNSPKYSNCFSVGSTADWEYYTSTTGTITSTNFGTMTLSRKGPAAQIGDGANITQDGYGASGWFNISGGTGYFKHGDFNVMLAEECVIVEDTLCGSPVIVETNTCKNTPITLCLDELLDLDSVFGTSDFALTAFEGASGDGYVATSSAQSSDAEDCCDFGKPTKLTFRYVSSNVTDNNQVDGKSSVTTYAQTQGNKVLIVANGNSSPSDLSDPYMSVSVNVGESFVLTQGAGKWSSNTYFHIMDSTGSNVLQLVRFHTSCSAPIVPGDRFGYITLLSSEIEGSTCGETGDDCTYSVVYYPDVDFEGTDDFNVEFCYSESGNQVCEVVRINIEVKDSVCKTGCPDDFEPVVIPSTLDAVVTSDAHDEDRATELPDGDFAKLEHDDEFIVLSLRELLEAGNELELVISSYGGDLAEGTVQGSYDGTVFGPPMTISTSNKKPSTKTEKLKFPYDVQFIKIIRDNDSEDKLLIDGARFDGTSCRPEIPDTIKLHTCVDETKTWNLNDILPEGSTVKDYTVTKTAGPAYGSYSLENSYDLKGCDLDKPKSFSLRYTGGTCASSDTEQEGDFKCKDEASLDGFSTVYVIVNDEKDKNKRLTNNDQYFVGNVSLNSVFKIDASLNNESSLPGKVYVWIMDPANNEILQKLEIKTDCKKPINLYDQFASMQVVRYEAKNGNGVISEVTELFESEYIPNTGFSGDDQIVLEICETENEDICQALVIDLEVNTIAPVALNDTAAFQPLTSGASVTEIDILANDSHSGGETLRVQTPFLIGPSISGATVTYDTILQRAIYTLNNPQDGDIDSFTYIVRTECSEDTAQAFIAFNGPVPVTWLDFDVTVVGANDVDLNWSTASEENNDYFVVERSLDGEVFESVSQHINGAGNSSEVSYYNHVDLNVPNGVIYYRVKQVDFDGQFDYSEIRLVNIFEQRTVVVYPNPARNEINIQVNGGNGEHVSITNLAGQEVATSQVASHGFVAIDATELPNGIYFVSIQSRWHNEIRKVIIQK